MNLLFNKIWLYFRLVYFRNSPVVVVKQLSVELSAKFFWASIHILITSDN